MSNAHTHNFTKLALIPVIADEKGTRRKEYDYAGIGSELPHFGTVVPMGVLARECACGKQQAFEYGKRQEMRVLKERLEKNNGQDADIHTV